MSRSTIRTPAGMVMLILLALLALALIAAPHHSAGGVFGQPGPDSAVSAPRSVYAPSH